MSRSVLGLLRPPVSGCPGVRGHARGLGQGSGLRGTPDCAVQLQLDGLWGSVARPHWSGRTSKHVRGRAAAPHETPRAGRHRPRDFSETLKALSDAGKSKLAPARPPLETSRGGEPRFPRKTGSASTILKVPGAPGLFLLKVFNTIKSSFRGNKPGAPGARKSIIPAGTAS